MKEIYKDIEGYENIYQVSNLGNVKRLSYKKYNKLTNGYSIYKERILKAQINRWGYKFVSLCKSSKVTIKQVHKLVAQTFIKNNHNYSCVNHKDGNKLNNNVDNLEWCTFKYNIQHAYQNGLMNNCKKVKQYDLNYNFIKIYNSINEASTETGINQGNISSCIKNKRKTSGGYIWKEVEE